MNKKIIAANIGNIIEWYDYILYGYLAPIMAYAFFPVKSHYAQLLAAFATFAAGYITRPLGGLVLAHVGDKYKRSTIIRSTVPIMIFMALLLGLMPTYQQAGIYAPIALTLIRLIQGFVTGGQSTATYVYVMENAPAKNRNRAVASAWSGLTAGILLGSLMCLLLFTINPNNKMIMWRIAYLSSIVFAIVWFFVYKNLDYDKKTNTTIFPLQLLLTQHRGTLMRAIIYTALPSITYYMLLIFGVTFLNQHGNLSLHAAMTITCAGLFLGIVVTPIVGFAADIVGRQTLMLFGCIGLLCLSYPIFHLLLEGNFWLSLLMIMLLMFFKDCFAAPGISTILHELPYACRFTGFSLAWNIANGIFGGTVPLISIWLIHHLQNPIAPCFYLLVFCAIALTALLSTRRHTPQPLIA